jgi:DNA-binding MarR family transcriptional regulator
MIALWEEDHQTVSDLGKRLSLDSGTLTPLLKKLEADGRIKRTRDIEDERKVWIDLTDEGKQLGIDAKDIPYLMYQSLDVKDEDAKKLYDILLKLQQERLVSKDEELK